MKTINELIKYYKVELDSLTEEIKHHEARKFNNGVQSCKGERMRVREILEYLKNLPNESKTVNRNENAEKFCTLPGDMTCPKALININCKDCEYYL